MLAPSNGTSFPPQTVTLQNTGNADLHISNTVTGDLTGFSRTDTCSGQTIPKQGTCTYQFSFTPAVAGPRQTTFTISDNATPNTQTITLLGSISGPSIIVTAATNPSVSFDGSTTTVTFATSVGIQVGTNITLTNADSVDIPIQNVKLAANENGFSLGDLTSCFSGALKAGTSCTFPVNFKPASAGPFTDSIAITTSRSGLE